MRCVSRGQASVQLGLPSWVEVEPVLVLEGRFEPGQTAPRTVLPLVRDCGVVLLILRSLWRWTGRRCRLAGPWRLPWAHLLRGSLRWSRIPGWRYLSPDRSGIREVSRLWGLLDRLADTAVRDLPLPRIGLELPRLEQSVWILNKYFGRSGLRRRGRSDLAAFATSSGGVLRAGRRARHPARSGPVSSVATPELEWWRWAGGYVPPGVYQHAFSLLGLSPDPGIGSVGLWVSRYGVAHCGLADAYAASLGAQSCRDRELRGHGGASGAAGRAAHRWLLSCALEYWRTAGTTFRRLTEAWQAAAQALPFRAAGVGGSAEACWDVALRVALPSLIPPGVGAPARTDAAVSARAAAAAVVSAGALTRSTGADVSRLVGFLVVRGRSGEARRTPRRLVSVDGSELAQGVSLSGSLVYPAPLSGVVPSQLGVCRLPAAAVLSGSVASGARWHPRALRLAWFLAGQGARWLFPAADTRSGAGILGLLIPDRAVVASARALRADPWGGGRGTAAGRSKPVPNTPGWRWAMAPLPPPPDPATALTPAHRASSTSSDHDNSSNDAISCALLRGLVESLAAAQLRVAVPGPGGLRLRAAGRPHALTDTLVRFGFPLPVLQNMLVLLPWLLHAPSGAPEGILTVSNDSVPDMSSVLGPEGGMGSQPPERRAGWSTELVSPGAAAERGVLAGGTVRPDHAASGMGARLPIWLDLLAGATDAWDPHGPAAGFMGWIIPLVLSSRSGVRRGGRVGLHQDRVAATRPRSRRPAQPLLLGSAAATAAPMPYAGPYNLGVACLLRALPTPLRYLFPDFPVHQVWPAGGVPPSARADCLSLACSSASGGGVAPAIEAVRVRIARDHAAARARARSGKRRSEAVPFLFRNGLAVADLVLVGSLGVLRAPLSASWRAQHLAVPVTAQCFALNPAALPIIPPRVCPNPVAIRYPPDKDAVSHGSGDEPARSAELAGLWPADAPLLPPLPAGPAPVEVEAGKGTAGVRVGGPPSCVATPDYARRFPVFARMLGPPGLVSAGPTTAAAAVLLFQLLGTPPIGPVMARQALITAALAWDLLGTYAPELVAGTSAPGVRSAARRAFESLHVRLKHGRRLLDPGEARIMAAASRAGLVRPGFRRKQARPMRRLVLGAVPHLATIATPSRRPDLPSAFVVSPRLEPPPVA